MTAGAVDCGHDFVADYPHHRAGARTMPDIPLFDLKQWHHELTRVTNLSN